MNNKKNKALSKNIAFTLVELIVVITILAILWTIAFISLSWYSQSSRDSVRISDMASMKSTLEYFNIDNGKYPVSTDAVDVTYSWAIVWSQWTFGEVTTTNINKLDRIPTDPLTSSKYTYSVTASRNNYLISGVLEWDEYLSMYLATNTYAGNTTWYALVSWSYNWFTAKALSWTTCNMISVPTLIANDLSNPDVLTIINSGSLVYNWYKNLPSSYWSAKFNLNWWFSFTPNNVIAYSDTWSCSDLLSGSSYTARIQLLKWIQDAYSGTILKDNPELSSIINSTIDVNTPSEVVKNLAWIYVNNNLWWAVAVTWASSITTSWSTSTGSVCILDSGQLDTCTLQ